MDNEITGIIAIIGGILFFIIRDKLATMFVERHMQYDRDKGIVKSDYTFEKKHAYKITLFMSAFALILGVLTFFGVVQAR